MLYWDVNVLDAFPQYLAEEMFDTGVNLGPQTAAVFLQMALNALNRNGVVYPDLVEDGKIATKTLDALRVVLGKGEETLVLKMLNVLQGAYYIERMRENTTQEKYARGWFDRVSFVKE